MQVQPSIYLPYKVNSSLKLTQGLYCIRQARVHTHIRGTQVNSIKRRVTSSVPTEAIYLTLIIWSQVYSAAEFEWLAKHKINPLWHLPEEGDEWRFYCRLKHHPFSHDWLTPFFLLINLFRQGRRPWTSQFYQRTFFFGQMFWGTRQILMALL